jgi:hypothetical protein
MPVTDRREPAVYVSIEDASYAAPALEIGRTVYAVILCDRGPHNRIVTVTSKQEFHQLFGQPDIRRVSQTFYQMDKALDYTGKALVCRVVPDDSYWANASVKLSTTAVQTIAEDFTFTHEDGTGVPNSDIVVCDTQAGYDFFDVGDFIYADGDTNGEAVQIISKDDSSGYQLVLESGYEGTGGVSTAVKYIPFSISSTPNVSSAADLPETDTEAIYHFYATGAGAYYNNIRVKGTRNVEMEKMYTDDNGVPLYKYLFMDLAVYYVKEDGTERLIEGPWTVSLIQRNAEGNTIRDITSGNVMYIEDVINDNSTYVQCVAGMAVDELVSGVLAEDKRLQVTLLLSESGPIGTQNIAGGGLAFENGTDGTGLYDTSGNIVASDTLLGLVKQAYMGSLVSVDGSVEQLPECVYPWFEPDYIVTGGYPAAIQDGGRFLADYRQDCIHLGDTGTNFNKYEDDLSARLNDVPWNNWTSALYVQYRKVFDAYTGRWIYMSPVYHAIERHLYCDGVYFIGEPVANIEKGAIAEKIELAYKANHTERGDLLDAELNPVIVEPQGKYILSQFTTWKRLSVLKRLHVAKFVAYIRKVIPTLLKDILQRKATQYWINQANFRVNEFLSQFVENPSLERYSILKSFSVNVAFDDVRSELNVYCDITPIRAIERINVYIIVH